MRFRILVANDRALKPFAAKTVYTDIQELEASGKSRLTCVEAEYNLRMIGAIEPDYRVVLIEEMAI